MSDTEKLSPEERLKAVLGMSGAALQLAMFSVAALAVRGLIHPDEVEKPLSAVLEIFDEMPAAVRDRMPYRVTEGLAEIKRVAAANWKGE